jgi:nucleoside triphosphate pyrophosphatase
LSRDISRLVITDKNRLEGMEEMTKKVPKRRPVLVLASASKRRKNLLKYLGIPIQTIVPAVDETWSQREDPRKTAVRLALEKARRAEKPDSLVIGMDTLVVAGGKILGKPVDSTDAESMLRLLSNKMHRVITGLALLYRGRRITDFEQTKVYFRKLDPSEIRWYVGTREPFDKAGAYAIQGKGRIFVSRIEGCYYNVVGFPLTCFQQSLRKLGFTILDWM